MCRIVRVNETMRLLAINDFDKSTMKESIFNVQLMDRPVAAQSKRKNSAYGGGFDDKTEGFIVVKARLL